MSSAPSPIVWVPVAQAVAIVLLKPRHWNRRAIRKEARLGMLAGMVNGFRRSKPEGTQHLDTVVHPVDTTHSGAEYHCGSFWLRHGVWEPRIANCLHGSRKGDLAKARHPPGFLAVNVLVRIKVWYLTGNLAGKVAGIELADPADTGFPFYQTLPQGIDRGPQC
jgi:hypothetical protein